MRDSTDHLSAQIGDFSSKATKKAVLSTTLQHPLTLYPVAVGILGALGIVLFNAPALAVGAAAGGFGVGVGTWLVNYLARNKTFASRYLEALQRKLESQRTAVLEKLKQDLVLAKAVQGAEDFARQGASQFKMIQDRFENLRGILAEKLNTGEITYARYLGTAEQVYLSVLDNLQNIATLLKSIRTIDQGYVRERMDALGKLGELAEADEQEMETLVRRLKLREDQIEKINTLLTHNERAMTELDQTTTAIASVQTVKGRATTDMETAIKELEELAKRSQRYGAGG